MSTEQAIITRDICRSFGDRRALDHVSLEVETGTSFALLGPNGGGKTTLFRILTTMLKPDSGEAKVGGYDPVTQPDMVRKHIGVVFQSPSLDVRLTVRENINLHGRLHGMSRAEIRRRSDEMLDRLQVADRVGDVVGTLSGGLARRVEIAKAMIPRPRILLLDEPSTGLDPVARRQTREALESLQKSEGVTICLTTHLMLEAERCKRLAVLDQGKLVAVGTPNELKKKVGGDVISIATPAPDDLSNAITERFQLEPARVGDELRIEVVGGAEWIPRLAAAFGEQIRSLTVGSPSLEDVFVHMTGHRLDEDTPNAN